MKFLLLTFLLSTTALANSADLNIDLSSKIQFLSYTKITAIMNQHRLQDHAEVFQGIYFHIDRLNSLENTFL
jgi:hypothetical protein